MKKSIIFGSFGQRTAKWHSGNVSSGYENTALAITEDGLWRNLDNELDNTYDVVVSTMPSGDSLGKKKSSRWGKLIAMEEAGFGVINTPWYIPIVNSIGYDGFLVHTESLLEHYRVFNKPVGLCTPAYPMDLVMSLSEGCYTEGNNNVCLNLSRFHSSEANVTAALRIMLNCPEINFVSYCDPVVGGDSLYALKDSLSIPNWQIHGAINWRSYIREAARCQAHLSMDNRMTWGRFQLDAYYTGSVCVGCSSQTQHILFPEYTVSPTEISKATDLLKSCVSNHVRIKPVIREEFLYETIKRQVTEFASSL